MLLIQLKTFVSNSGQGWHTARVIIRSWMTPVLHILQMCKDTFEDNILCHSLLIGQELGSITGLL
jgi:hypothetical protein